MMNLLDVPKYAREWPQVALIKEIEGDRVLVQWFKESKTTSWQSCARRSGTKRKCMPWMDYVDRKAIWFFDFHLTMSGKLPQQVQEKTENYDEL